MLDISQNIGNILPISQKSYQDKDLRLNRVWTRD